MGFVSHHGDCLEIMAAMSAECVHAIVTDPPYHLTSGKVARGFMGQSWDGGNIAADPATWEAAYRVLKPGGYLLAFGGSRTYHRMACAIEDAGFEIRDQIMWLYGSGFPKSLNVSKAIDPATEAAKQWEGWRTALKPAHEPICVARKPLIGTVAENVLRHGTGAMNIDGCRIESSDSQLAEKYWSVRNAAPRKNKVFGGDSSTRAIKPHDLGRFPANVIHDGSDEVLEGLGDFGFAARFFYCAKTPKKERRDSKHPTIKPLALMKYLCRLVTPEGGTVLDPFAGSGTTGEAALLCGFNAILIEKEEAYYRDIQQRMNQEEGRLRID